MISNNFYFKMFSPEQQINNRIRFTFFYHLWAKHMESISPLKKFAFQSDTPPPSLFHFQNELMNKFIYFFNHQNIHKLFPSFFLSKFLGNIISRLFSEQFFWENLTRALSGGVNNYHDYCGLMGWGGYETTTV